MNQAIDVYLSLINLDFSYRFANNNLSLIYLELGEYDKSIKHAKNALDINDDYHDAKYNLALSLFEKRLYRIFILAKNLINVESHKAKAYELKIRIEQLICDWSSYENTNELLSKNKIIVHPFLHISHVMDNEKNQINARYWTNQLSNNKKG